MVPLTMYTENCTIYVNRRGQRDEKSERDCWKKMEKKFIAGDSDSRFSSLRVRVNLVKRTEV